MLAFRVHSWGSSPHSMITDPATLQLEGGQEPGTWWIRMKKQASGADSSAGCVHLSLQHTNFLVISGNVWSMN